MDIPTTTKLSPPTDRPTDRPCSTCMVTAYQHVHTAVTSRLGEKVSEVARGRAMWGCDMKRDRNRAQHSAPSDVTTIVPQKCGTATRQSPCYATTLTCFQEYLPEMPCALLSNDVDSSPRRPWPQPDYILNERASICSWTGQHVLIRKPASAALVLSSFFRFLVSLCRGRCRVPVLCGGSPAGTTYKAGIPTSCRQSLQNAEIKASQSWYVPKLFRVG